MVVAVFMTHSFARRTAAVQYTNCTAAVLRAKECVMKTATTIQENAEDIYAEAQQINEDRAAKAAQEFDGEVEAEAAETAADAE